MKIDFLNSLEICASFFEFEKTIKKEQRGGKIMYDVKGQYKWLTLTELFDYWKNK